MRTGDSDKPKTHGYMVHAVIDHVKRDWAETKYMLVMRLAERWGIEAFQQQVTPQEYCSRKFSLYSHCRDWSEVTKIILTAFVIREHAIYQQFFKDIEL